MKDTHLLLLEQPRAAYLVAKHHPWKLLGRPMGAVQRVQRSCSLLTPAPKWMPSQLEPLCHGLLLEALLSPF